MLRHARALGLVGSLIGLGLFVGGCAPAGQLVADDGSHRMQAQHPGSGLTVVLTTEAWDGHPDVARDVTIVHVLVANHGERPVLLAPGDFELRDMRGFRYDLLDTGHSFRAVGPDDTPGAAGPDGYDPGMATGYRTLSSTDEQVARSALPWGVLLPGTQMRGYLYFEPVEDAANHATITWYVETPDHARVVDLSFDLHVARPRA